MTGQPYPNTPTDATVGDLAAALVSVGASQGINQKLLGCQSAHACLKSTKRLLDASRRHYWAATDQWLAAHPGALGEGAAPAAPARAAAPAPRPTAPTPAPAAPRAAASRPAAPAPAPAATPASSPGAGALPSHELAKRLLVRAKAAGVDDAEIQAALGIDRAALEVLALGAAVNEPPDFRLRATDALDAWANGRRIGKGQMATQALDLAAAAPPAPAPAPAPAASPARAAATAPGAPPPRPASPPIDFDAIPQELREGNWVLWRFVLKKNKRDGTWKWTKPPVQRSGALASSKNPATWCTFDEARAVLELGRRWPDGTPELDGFGRVLATTDARPLFGFDLDDCIKYDSNGDVQIDADAMRAVKEMGTYAEISPSGQGIRIIGLGNLPGSPYTNNAVGREAYDSAHGGRYLTITSRVLPGFDFVRAPDPAILAKWHSQWDTHSPGSKSSAPAAANAAAASAGAGTASASTSTSTSTSASSAYVDVDLAARGIRAHVRALIESLDGLDTHYAGDRSKALLGAAIELLKAKLTDDEVVSVLTDPKHAIHTVAQGPGRRNTRDSAAQWIRAYTLPTAHQKAAAQAAAQQASVNIGATGVASPQHPNHRARPFTLAEMLTEAVYIAGTGQIVLRDSLRTQYESLKGFHDATVASKHQGVDKNNKPVEYPASRLWFNSPDKLQRHALTFSAGEPEMTLDPEGRPSFNLWQRRAHVAPADWRILVQPFLDHITYLVPDAPMREWLLDWLAYIEQRPGTLPHTHFAHVARQHGLGRNWVGSVLARVFAGVTALGFDLSGYLHNGFNGLLSCKELVIVDELHEKRHGTGRADAEDMLRRALTEEFTTINPKYGKQRTEKNSKRWMVWSNREDALPLGAGDRRWNVVRHDGDPRNADYYTMLYGLLDDAAFVASVREFLVQRDTSRFNPGAHAMLNQAKLDMIDAGRSEEERNAALLVARWPSEMIRSSVALRAVQPGSTAFTGINLSGGTSFNQAMRAAGAVKGDRTTVAGVEKAHTWILGDHERWKTATVSERQKEIERGEAAIGFDSLAAAGVVLLKLLDGLPDRPPS